ncbi:shikimate dehydrogenase [Bacillus massilinigeriensis]|uniref:shikimate dehydrogenase n=1 Tax=Bacillus mediterraneensis TaxID=1805474 RepID=UPI0008F93983|nr:shikimate dehydrogenase [Bacillus mediterraneensis]
MKKLYGVIGDPIAHSMSPAMHNDLFRFYQCDAEYFPFRVNRSSLKEAVLGLKAIGAGGFNVTIPHKTSVIELMDEMDPLALSIGAVNTVTIEDGRLIGHNTDGPGFVRGLEEKLGSIEDRKVLIVGAGGAAKGIFYSIAASGVSKIDIANRTLSKAEALLANCPFDVHSSILDLDTAERKAGDYSLIIQTTSIGMNPLTEEAPLSLHNLRKGSFISDIIYNPLKTRFLQQAEANGAGIQNGLDMFVWQGALAFEKWTGIFPDLERMRNTVMNQLGGTTC